MTIYVTGGAPQRVASFFGKQAVDWDGVYRAGLYVDERKLRCFDSQTIFQAMGLGKSFLGVSYSFTDGAIKLSSTNSRLAEIVIKGRELDYVDGFKEAGFYFLASDQAAPPSKIAHALIAHGAPDLYQKRRPCLFLDRDGVLIEDTGYPDDPSKIKLIHRTFEFARNWTKDHDGLCCVVTNQSGLARGRFFPSTVSKIHQRIFDHAKTIGLDIHGLSVGGHLPNVDRSGHAHKTYLRKPGPGGVLMFCDSHAVDIHSSLMVGDRSSDEIDLWGLSFKHVSEI